VPLDPNAGCLAGVELWLVEWLMELALDDGELPVDAGGELSVEAAGAGVCVATGWVTGVPVLVLGELVLVLVLAGLLLAAAVATLLVLTVVSPAVP
jgi:hypothetical protein